MADDARPKLLITGGSGFIGTNLIAAAAASYPDLVNMDVRGPMNPAQASHHLRGDILDAEETLAIFRKIRPTHVVHLAARCDCDENTTVEAGYRANTAGTANVLRAIKEAGTVRRLVVASTQFVFNKGAELPQGDLDYHPVTVYGQSKVITETLTRDSGLNCCWTLIRPTNVWGPWHIRHTKQFFRILRAGLYAHPGGAPVVRSYAYVGNVADQILKILAADEAAVAKRTLYVGDAPQDIFEWVDGFSKSLTGKPARKVPRFLLRATAWTGDLISWVTRKEFSLTSSRYRSMTLPYLTPMDRTFALLGPPRYSLAEGIRQTTEWLKTFEASGITTDDRPMTA